MKRFAVIGYPITHSLSPILHQEIYRQLEINASFEKFHIKPDDLHSFMNSNKLDGFNVTIPYKQTVIPFLDDLDESAQTISAVNCIYNRKGYNTDWIGFTLAMEMNDIELKDKHCSILGAGGAARAVAYSLIKAGVKSIFIQNRTQENGEIIYNAPIISRFLSNGRPGFKISSVVQFSLQNVELKKIETSPSGKQCENIYIYCKSIVLSRHDIAEPCFQNWVFRVLLPELCLQSFVCRALFSELCFLTFV